MKLYLSSYRIPTPDALADLVGKPLNEIHMAVIPNAKDYYAERAWNYKVNDFVVFASNLGMKPTVVDLRKTPDFTGYDLIWAIGGNTFCLRYEMQRSGFDNAIRPLLEKGVVYGGDSAGAIVAGVSLKGVEHGDEPQFAENIITEGLGLINYAIIPHVDSPGFADVAVKMQEIQEKAGNNYIILNDSQAAVFTDGSFVISDSNKNDQD